jgi:hypothetical protein
MIDFKDINPKSVVPLVELYKTDESEEFVITFLSLGLFSYKLLLSFDTLFDNINYFTLLNMSNEFTINVISEDFDSDTEQYIHSLVGSFTIPTLIAYLLYITLNVYGCNNCKDNDDYE